MKKSLTPYLYDIIVILELDDRLLWPGRWWRRSWPWLMPAMTVGAQLLPALTVWSRTALAR